MAIKGTKQAERRPEGKEGAGARAIRQHGESESAGRKEHVGDDRKD